MCTRLVLKKNGFVTTDRWAYVESTISRRLYRDVHVLSHSYTKANLNIFFVYFFRQVSLLAPVLAVTSHERLPAKLTWSFHLLMWCGRWANGQITHAWRAWHWVVSCQLRKTTHARWHISCQASWLTAKMLTLCAEDLTGAMLELNGMWQWWQIVYITSCWGNRGTPWYILRTTRSTSHVMLTSWGSSYKPDIYP